MSETQNTLGIASLIISGFALLFSGISLRINYIKYRLDKSKLKVEIEKYWMSDLTSRYPSMEDDKSEYIIHLSIENTGYKEELIKKIIFYLLKEKKENNVTKVINAKSKESFSFSLKREEMIKLRKIEIVPSEDRKLTIRKRELSKWKKNILSHIEQLLKEWKDGRKIDINKNT